LNLLAFDTSTEHLSVALSWRAGGELRTLSHAGEGGREASAALIPVVQGLLREAGLPLAALDALVFGAGPGAFTGLRTACAVAQGLAFGANLPVLPIDTLLAVAEDARLRSAQPQAPMTVLAVLDARMDEVYSAAYQWDGQTWQALQALQVGPPQDLVPPALPFDLLVGNAFEAYGERLSPALAGERVQALPTASALLRLAPALFAQGQAVPAEQAMPLYIRDKVAQTTAERMAQRNATPGTP